MSRKFFISLFILVSIVFLASCGKGGATETPQAVGIANPASVYCEEHGGTVDIRTAADGSQSGACVFPDGSECDEWAYFRGECQPLSATANPESKEQATILPTEEIASDGWKVYRNESLGFSFHYPADSVLESAEDPSKTLTITGPLSGEEHWPMIFVNFPSDRADYLPPENVNLEQWLTEHELLAGERQDDLTIAGVPAIHVSLTNTQQSYPSDTYFFAHKGQLYSIIFLHTGNKQDWDLYNHFLESFVFE